MLVQLVRKPPLKMWDVTAGDIASARVQEARDSLCRRLSTFALLVLLPDLAITQPLPPKGAELSASDSLHFRIIIPSRLQFRMNKLPSDIAPHSVSMQVEGTVRNVAITATSLAHTAATTVQEAGSSESEPPARSESSSPDHRIPVWAVQLSGARTSSNRYGMLGFQDMRIACEFRQSTDDRCRSLSYTVSSP